VTDSTWNVNAADGNYNNSSNWSFGVPGLGDTAFFGISNQTTISIGSANNVDAWVFTSAENYRFITDFVSLDFFGSGIVNGVNIQLDTSAFTTFHNESTAGAATIINLHFLNFLDRSSAGNATIFSGAESVFTNQLVFAGHSTAGNATITNGRTVVFQENSTGGTATINNYPASTVDFSQSAGPAGDHKLSIGSINGSGTYLLSGNQLTVLAGDVSGLIDGFGGSLVKVGPGALTLSGAGNTYSGGSTLEGGTFDVAGPGSAGTGPISFAGKATLKVDNAALSGHVLTTNNIDFFGKHDVLDLTGLHFHHGAKVTYHNGTHLLTVRSGHVTDVLTLLSPHGTHFIAANDGRGGTKITLDPPPAAAHAVASLSGHDPSGEWAGDLSASSNHMSDFLFVA
jgi:autotransporter-associated beta strand protein